MTAVVQTVKASYIASTKYRNRSGNKEVRLIDMLIKIRLILFSQLFNGKCVYQERNL